MHNISFISGVPFFHFFLHCEMSSARPDQEWKLSGQTEIIDLQSLVHMSTQVFDLCDNCLTYKAFYMIWHWSIKSGFVCDYSHLHISTYRCLCCPLRDAIKRGDNNVSDTHFYLMISRDYDQLTCSYFISCFLLSQMFTFIQ